jgi:uroporphyrin-III C-methyltransferase/precorrin-2 dehydrogenase/sirohydrochlorin ferrochelatase
MRSLPLFHRIAGQPVIVLGEGEAAEAKRRLVERAGGLPVGEDHAEARLAFVALVEPEEVAVRLKARGVLVNVTDRPDLCDFTVPSVLDRDPVLVAVGTGGASAGLAKHLRLRLEQLLPSDLGRLAEALHGARAKLRGLFPDASRRRGALDVALQEGGPIDPLTDGACERLETWIEAGGEPAPIAPVTLTIASDDPDDLTLGQARLLGIADWLIVEPGIAPAILDRARADAVRLEWPAEPPGEGRTVILRRG